MWPIFRKSGLSWARLARRASLDDLSMGKRPSESRNSFWRSTTTRARVFSNMIRSKVHNVHELNLNFEVSRSITNVANRLRALFRRVTATFLSNILVYKRRFYSFSTVGLSFLWLAAKLSELCEVYPIMVAGRVIYCTKEVINPSSG